MHSTYFKIITFQILDLWWFHIACAIMRYHALSWCPIWILCISMWYLCSILVIFASWSSLILDSSSWYVLVTWRDVTGTFKVVLPHLQRRRLGEFPLEFLEFRLEYDMNTKTQKVQWKQLQYNTLQWYITWYTWYKKHIFVVFVYTFYTFWIFAASVFAGHPTDLTMWINRHADALNHNVLQYCLTDRKSQSHWL